MIVNIKKEMMILTWDLLIVNYLIKEWKYGLKIQLKWIM